MPRLPLPGDCPSIPGCGVSGAVKRWAGLALCAVMAAGCGSQPAPPPEFTLVASVRQIMDAIVEPSADVIWMSVSTIFTRDGVTEHRPTTDEEWQDVRNAAISLAESANLLLMEGRALPDPEWAVFAGDLVDATLQAIATIDDRDSDRLLLVGGDIYDTCVQCHERYVAGP